MYRRRAAPTEGSITAEVYIAGFSLLLLLCPFLNTPDPSPFVVREQKTVKKGMAQRHSRFTHDWFEANEQVLRESKKEAVPARGRNTSLGQRLWKEERRSENIRCKSFGVILRNRPIRRLWLLAVPASEAFAPGSRAQVRWIGGCPSFGSVCRRSDIRSRGCHHA